MREVTTKLYQFAELSEESKENAINEMRESYYRYNDFSDWAIDDCYLFEPLQAELDEIGYKSGKVLIENTRKNIYFETSSFLDCENAMLVTDDNFFLNWLGIDNTIDGLEDIRYCITTPQGRNRDTTIEFSDYAEKFESLIEQAIDKFDNHISDVLRRIESSIDYNYTDEAIIDDIEANEVEFTEDGNRY